MNTLRKIENRAIATAGVGLGLTVGSVIALAVIDGKNISAEHSVNSGSYQVATGSDFDVTRISNDQPQRITVGGIDAENALIDTTLVLAIATAASGGLGAYLNQRRDTEEWRVEHPTLQAR